MRRISAYPVSIPPFHQDESKGRKILIRSTPTITGWNIVRKRPNFHPLRGGFRILHHLHISPTCILEERHTQPQCTRLFGERRSCSSRVGSGGASSFGLLIQPLFGGKFWQTHIFLAQTPRRKTSTRSYLERIELLHCKTARTKTRRVLQSNHT